MKQKHQPEKPAWWQRLWHKVVPPMPDFYGMLQAQANNLSTTLSALTSYMQAVESQQAVQVNALVGQGRELRNATLHTLHSSFITPIDREDIYSLAMAIDHILDYVKSTVREVDVLQVHPNEWMKRMTMELSTGAKALAAGIIALNTDQARAITAAGEAQDAERRVEELYRAALANMFEGEEYDALQAETDSPQVKACLDFIIKRMKRREVYRHLSNAADRLAYAGERLSDICIKYDNGTN